jgi:hypothetical protein
VVTEIGELFRGESGMDDVFVAVPAFDLGWDRHLTEALNLLWTPGMDLTAARHDGVVMLVTVVVK